MGHEIQRLIDPLLHEPLNIINGPVFATGGDMADGFVKPRARSDQRIRQVEHLLKALVANHQTQIAVIDRHRLGNQVEPGGGHRGAVFFGSVHAVSHGVWLAS